MAWDTPAQVENLPTASTQLVNGRVLVMGYAVAETTGTTASKVRIRDGTTTAGTRFITIALAANESVRDWFGPNGLLYQQGLYIEVVSGSTEGSIFCIPEVSVGAGVFARLLGGLTEGFEHVVQR